NALVSALVGRSTLDIAGDVTADAKAVTGVLGHGADAAVNLALGASVGNVTVLGAVDVDATASAHGAGKANAIALALVLGKDSASGVTIGSLTDHAIAKSLGGGTAIATAIASAEAPNIHIAGDADVLASAFNNGGAGPAAARAGLLLLGGSCG